MSVRRVRFTSDARDDYGYWQGQDRKTLKRINQLIREAQRTPFEGIGKPEPLKANLSVSGHAASTIRTVSSTKRTICRSASCPAAITTRSVNAATPHHALAVVKPTRLDSVISSAAR